MQEPKRIESLPGSNDSDTLPVCLKDQANTTRSAQKNNFNKGAGSVQKQVSANQTKKVSPKKTSIKEIPESTKLKNGDKN